MNPMARHLVATFVAAGVMANTPVYAQARADSVSDSQAQVAIGDGSDIRGPMIVSPPADICSRTIPERTGLPPDHPLANRDDPTIQADAAAYAREQQIRTLQALYCNPVLDPAVAAQAKGAIPAACFQPAEAAAAVDPNHPLADKERSDVVAAEQYYLAAVARVHELRARCIESATGKKVARPMVPVSQF